MANPTPGVAVVFQAGRYSFEGEDKAKVERIRKFYAPLGSIVEFAELTAQEARLFARELARHAELTIGGEALEYLTESLGASAARIAAEIEKLRLYRGRGATITEADIAALAPDARETTIFALVAALGRGDRLQSMRILDTLVREGEYLPLALSFLATQLRLALMAREAGLKGPQQVQAHFTRLGTPMWRARAEQVWQTASLFSKEKLARSLQLVFQADHGLRDTRPDDRIVMERFILSLTA
jgi:DNA polymerase-3 subunit delta